LKCPDCERVRAQCTVYCRGIVRVIIQGTPYGSALTTTGRIGRVLFYLFS